MQAGCTEASSVAQATAEKISASFKAMQTQVASSMTTMQTEMKTGFSSVSTAMGKLNGAFMAVTAALAGGAAFKKVVDETVEWTGSSITLARQLGATTEEASTLMVATERLGMSHQQISSVLKGLVRNLKSNEEGLNQMGIATKDSNGKTLGMIDIMLNANKVLLGYKEGKDRDVAMMAVYGRAALENSKFIKLNATVMEEAKRRAEELHLKVGPEGVAQFQAYRAATIDAKEVLRSLAIQIGSAVMPAITQLGAWMGSTGPQLIEIFVGALKGIISFFEYVGLGAVALYEAVKAALSNICTIAVTSAKVMMNALMGNWPGVIDATVNGANKMEDVSTGALMNIAKAANSTNESLGKLWGLTPTKTANLDLGGGGTRQYDNDAKVDKSKGKAAESRVPEWQEQLQQKLEAEKNFFKASLSEELTFWKQKLQIADLSTKERIEINHKVYQIEKQQAQDQLQAEIQVLKEQYDNALEGSEQRVEIVKQEAIKVKGAYGEQSKEYKQMLREIDKAQREHEADLIKRKEAVLDKEREVNLIAIDMERDKLEFMAQADMMNDNQYLERKRQLAEKEYQIEIQAQQQKIKLARQGSLEQQKEMLQLETMEKKHAQIMAKIDMDAQLKSVNTWKSAFQSITSSFSSAIKGMVTGTVTFKKAIQDMATNILGVFIDMIVEMVAKWAWGQMMKLISHETTESSIQATETANNAASLAQTLSTNIAEAMSYAALAAVQAMSSVAAIPWVGWAMAPAVGATTYAEAMGFAGMAAAAGGYDIPAGVNPVTQLHQEEMVLPADIAKPLRGMVKGGGSGGGDTNISIVAVDSKSFKQLLSGQNGRTLASAIKTQARNFNGAFR